MSLFDLLGGLIQAPFKLLSGGLGGMGGQQLPQAQAPQPQDFQEWLKTTKYSEPVTEEYARKMASMGGGGIFYPSVPKFNNNAPGPGMPLRAPYRPSEPNYIDPTTKVGDMSQIPGERPQGQLGGILGVLANNGKLLQSPVPQGLVGGDFAENDFFKRVAKIESNHNPRAVSPTGAKGLYQFTRGTWRDIMGSEGNPFNPQDATVAMQKLTSRNKKILKEALGRDPKQFELYMAHNIGPGGAKALLTANPNQHVSRSLIGSKPSYNPKFLMGRSGPLTVSEAIQRYMAAFGGR